MIHDYPYTNFHELNANWIINEMRKHSKEWDDFYNKLSEEWRKFSEQHSAEWNNFQTSLTGEWNNFKSDYTNMWNAFKTEHTELWDTFYNKFSKEFLDNYIINYGSLENETDADTVLKNGFWNINGGFTYTNIPVKSGYFQAVYKDGIVYQIAINGSQNHTEYGQFWFRSGYGAPLTFGEWISFDNANYIASNMILDSTDLNELKAPGAWGISQNKKYKNAPIIQGSLLVLVNSNSVYQIVVDGSENESEWGGVTSSGDRYFRSFISNKWSPWSKISVDKKTFSDRCVDEVGGVQYTDNRVVITQFEQGLYVNQNGKLEDAPTFCRTKTLIKARSRHGYRLQTVLPNITYIVWFDCDYNYISFANLTRVDLLPVVAPENAEYFGINYTLNGGDIPNEIVLELVNSENIISITGNAVENGNILRVVERVVNNDGSLSAPSTTFKCVFLANPKCKKVFVNNNSTEQCFCRNFKGENVTPTTFKQITPTGREYTIPDNVAVLGINLYNTDNNYAAFTYNENIYSFSTERNTCPPQRLTGRKVMCIGDSITFLDGREADGTSRFTGYQSYLRMAGATVDSLGYSGVPYAKNNNTDSIADNVVDKKTPLSYYNTIILFGGSNDVRLSTTIGDPNTVYNNKNIDSNSFIGAVGKLINYCRTQSPTAEIFLCTILPSEDASRPYEKITKYNEALKELGRFWNVPVIDTFSLVNWQPFGNLSNFCYDTTHPNQKGMERIGRIMAGYINNYLNIIGNE